MVIITTAKKKKEKILHRPETVVSGLCFFLDSFADNAENYFLASSSQEENINKYQV